MSPIKLITSSLFLLFITSSPVLAQKDWSEWKEDPSNPELLYRISFAKADEVENKAGYFVEIKNESENRAWFTFKLFPEAGEKRGKSLTTLKPSTQSVIGIYWSNAVTGTVPTGIFMNVKFEPLAVEQTLVKVTEESSAAR
ncbi:MAG: hypothetical protein J0L62_01910 [Bacteroidetes bacterium]|nr:hypothetical protein [Bacteroidota bacterium]